MKYSSGQFSHYYVTGKDMHTHMTARVQANIQFI